VVMIVEIKKELLYPFLIFDKPIRYKENITFNPVKMKNIIEFQQSSLSITFPKDSIVTEKQLIKMSYFDFIKYAHENKELAEKYDSPLLPYYWTWALSLIRLTLDENIELKYNQQNLSIFINDEEISSEIFDDIRKIIILQNDIDYDVDEFMNKDTIQALEKAREFEMKKRKEKSDIEDYIDSMVVGLKVTEEYISNLSIRKFWRYIKRLNKHEDYLACRSGEMSGMVTFKEPYSHWMSTISTDDKYENLKADEGELRGKVG